MQKMKNLTHYFKNTSPPETSSPQNNSENGLDESTEEPSSSQTLKQSHGKKKKRKESSIVANVKDSVSLSPNGIFPDLIVNVGDNGEKCSAGDNTELLKEVSLNHIVENDNCDSDKSKDHTNRNISKKKRVKKHIQTSVENLKVSNDCDEEIIIIESSQNSCEVEINNKSTKLNAFKFMMESRTKSLGRNSPGREKYEEIDDDEMNKLTNKEKLSARKTLFQEWADKKGGLKRKRIEEETEEICKVKLEKRAARLKKMLTTKQSKKQTVVIDSDSENTEKDEVVILEEQKTESESDSNILKIKMFSPKPNKRKRNKSRLSLSKTEKTETTIVIDVVEKCEQHNQSNVEENALNEPENKSEINVSVNNTTNSNLRRSTRNRKPTQRLQEIIYIDSEVNEESNVRKQTTKKLAKVEKVENKKPVKLAPIFLRNSPKPPIDPKLIEAKRNFLYSDIPESLKKAIDKQKSVETKELEIFPQISHIQQQDDESPFWKLPSVDFAFRKHESPVKLVQNFVFKPRQHIERNKKIAATPETKNVNIRLILKEIKNEYPEFPVYKTFRRLREKNRKLKFPNKTETEFAVWTEKYKAQASVEILGNTNAVRELKNWLKSWMDLSRDFYTEKTKRKRNNSSSSEFDTSDGDSRGSMGLPNNTVIVSGPVASGKTMTVYAIANELDINVLELNASSKRTGKRLLQELQEATQSHQVRKSTFEMSKPEMNTKMCLLLVEDVDIVFEQDEGFLTSLSKLLDTSKRPVVLVTSDIHAQNLIKFTTQHKIIKFNKVADGILSSWLQLVCLLEGLFVAKKSLQQLLQFNRGDVRRTLLQLQILFSSINVKQTTEIVSVDNDDDCVEEEEEEEKITKTVCVVTQENCLNTLLKYSNRNDLTELLNDQTSIRDVAKLLQTQSDLDLLEFDRGFCVKNNAIKDSLELKENLQVCEFDYYLADEIKDCIFETTLNIYKKNTHIEQTNNNRFCEIKKDCDGVFVEILPHFVRADRRAMFMDYLPTLREISRLEMDRLAVNNKRRNRFYNYLQGLGVDCNEGVLKTACELFV